eukprot:CAMPEP_0201579700 /NCGR_PEP_ID=MMETSP0190_2-20130828/27443_1 /ASSEMBLY_ACC=CAM_ASM_000263 /TAXON_ID=37353 /ORGANISM="Rosalina sp." /LENGTH=291 /DNA_ID=CAMNT_0048014487 /DNA_START=1227 /DNA_END=2102 /DNA_ORIENTATION=-
MDIIFIQFCGDILDKEVSYEQKKVHREQSEQNSLKVNEPSHEKSKSEKSKSHPNKLQIHLDKENSLRRTTSLYSNGAEIPDIERAITPRPKDWVNGINKLTVDISANSQDEHHLFRPPSPSPSPIAELPPVARKGIKREIQIKPPRLSTVSSFGDKRSNKGSLDEHEEEHDEEEKQAVLSSNDGEGSGHRTTRKRKGSVKNLAARFEGGAHTKLHIKNNNNTNNNGKKRRGLKLDKLRINVLSRSGDDFDNDTDDGVITPMSPTPMSPPPPPLTPNANDTGNVARKRKYWQ